MPLNNNKCPGEQFPPFSLSSHQHNVRLRNGSPQQPWPNFRDKLGSKNIPYWGPNCVVRVLDLVDGEFQDVSIGALLTLPALTLPSLPFHVSYPVLTLVQLAAHNCIHCPKINFPEDSGNPLYEFHLGPAAESHPSSDEKLSSSSSMAESQSSHHSLASSPSAAKLQPSSRYNYRSNDTSNPHSPGLDNWQSNRSSNMLSSDSYINGPSNNSSNPHSPGIDPWQSNGTIGEGKGSSSGSYNLETDDGQVPQGSSGSSSSSKRLAVQGLSRGVGALFGQ